MNVQLTNWQQRRDVIVSVWTKMSEECLLNLCHKELGQKRVQPGTNQVYLIKCLSVS